MSPAMRLWSREERRGLLLQVWSQRSGTLKSMANCIVGHEHSSFMLAFPGSTMTIQQAFGRSRLQGIQKTRHISRHRRMPKKATGRGRAGRGPANQPWDGEAMDLFVGMSGVTRQPSHCHNLHDAPAQVVIQVGDRHEVAVPEAWWLRLDSSEPWPRSDFCVPKQQILISGRRSSLSRCWSPSTCRTASQASSCSISVIRAEFSCVDCCEGAVFISSCECTAPPEEYAVDESEKGPLSSSLAAQVLWSSLLCCRIGGKGFILEG